MKTSGKNLLIALIAHSLSKCGLELLEVFKKLEKSGLGSCEFIDGLTNPINIAIEASERNLNLLIVGCSTGDKGGYESGRFTIKEYEPLSYNERIDAEKLVKEVYEGFLGSIDVDSMARALRLVYEGKFRAVKIYCENDCDEVVSRTLNSICLTRA